MAAFASDDFSEANGTAIAGKSLDVGGTWSLNASFLSANARTDGTSGAYGPSNNSGAQSPYLASVTPPSSDYAVSFTLLMKSVVAGSRVGVLARSSSSGTSIGYALIHSTTGNTLQLFQVTSGTFTQIGSSSSLTLTAGQSAAIELKVQGTTITASVNGSAVITVTDSTFSSAGLVGVIISNNGTALTATTGPHIQAFSATQVTSNTPITVSPSGAYTITGGAATFTTITGVNFMVNPGAYALTGGPATISSTQTYQIPLTAGAYTLTGGSAIFGGKAPIIGDVGHYTITGGTASFDLMCPEVLPINSTLTASDIITNAMIDLGVLSAGEVPTGEETDVGIRVLNWMLKTWQSRGVTSWRNVECFITFPPGVTTMVLDHYCIDVMDARLQQATNYERPLQRWELAQYRQIPNKQTPGYPTSYTISKTSNTISMTVWPVPYVPMTVNYSYARIIRDVVNGTDEVDIPQEWLEAVTLGLAARLTSSLGINRIDPATAVDIKQRAAATEQLLFDEDRPASLYLGSAYGRRF